MLPIHKIPPFIFAPNSEAHPVDPGALACCSPTPAERDQENLWMGMDPHEVAELILNPDKKLDYGIHKHNVHKDLIVNREHVELKNEKDESVKGVEYFHRGESKPINLKGDVENMENIIQEKELESKELNEEKDLIAEKLKEVKGQRISDDMPVHFEEANIDKIKKNVDDIVNEYHRRNRYANLQKPTAEVTKTDKLEENKKFEPSYDEEQTTVDNENLEGKIITSTKTQISEENKEFEADSNLTSNGKNDKINNKPEDDKSAVVLNLPRFGAILAENNSGRGEATPVGENSGISTSVSSSKYSNPSLADTAGAKIVQELLQPMLKKVANNFNKSIGIN